ncbi:hypothetical protein CR205_12420 [Alteribacter lacisalsi]|uniref:Uncharacterized protein n=1 Tax=Alteribacter lacisalsi TaxID=2045244 RepID=A0A2W0HGH0_9BACI|nr:hypothetical protein [Alteribacter lacisalsi]PYZ96515.1 hypothetical protein CR205_12420 [Alteribacter lacisalsi]
MKNEHSERKFKEDEAFVRSQMNYDQVDVPAIPLERSRMSRFFRYLGSPARNPFERFEAVDGGGAVRIVLLPAAAGVALMLVQAGVYLFF